MIRYHVRIIRWFVLQLSHFCIAPKIEKTFSSPKFFNLNNDNFGQIIHVAHEHNFHSRVWTPMLIKVTTYNVLRFAVFIQNVTLIDTEFFYVRQNHTCSTRRGLTTKNATRSRAEQNAICLTYTIIFEEKKKKKYRTQTDFSTFFPYYNAITYINIVGASCEKKSQYSCNTVIVW